MDVEINDNQTKDKVNDVIDVTYENYTDKNEIIQDCLTELEPFIEKVIPSNKTVKLDCTDIETDLIMDEYLKELSVS